MPWLPCTHVDQRRPHGALPSSGKGPQASLCVSSLETIRLSAEISRIFKDGKRLSNRYLSLIFVPVPEGQSNLEASFEHGRPGRVAFIAGKRNGNACWRNAAKRRMRELVRQLGGPWPGFDMLFIAKRSLTEASYSKVVCATAKTLEDLDMGKSNASAACEIH